MMLHFSSFFLTLTTHFFHKQQVIEELNMFTIKVINNLKEPKEYSKYPWYDDLPPAASLKLPRKQRVFLWCAHIVWILILPVEGV